MKKYVVLILVVFFSSCKIEQEITIHKVEGSPEYPNAKINLNEPVAIEDGYEFSFDVISYELGMHVSLNGEDYKYSYITHKEILNGGELEFTMGAKPNKNFGKEKKYRPKSIVY